MDDLLKDAIADAKAVRETALANAKLALEEAFTPRIQSMLSDKIQSEIEGEEEAPVVADEEEEVPAEAPAEAPAEEEAPEVAVEPEMGEEEADEDMTGKYDEEEEMEVAPEEPAVADEMEDEVPVEEPAVEGEDDVIEINGVKYAPVVSEEEEEMGDEVAPEVEENEDLDLESILRELEDEEGEPVEEEYDENAVGDGLDSDEVETAPEAELAENDVSSDIGDADNKVNDDAADSSETGAQGPEGEGSDKPAGKENSEDEVVDDLQEDIDLEEVLKALTEEDGEEEEEAEAAVEELNTLKSDLEEHRNVVKYLRGKLNEVNLLNAKLLFTNKLFRNFGLNNEQKLKVVETFDRATNLREVKLVFSTLAESFGNKVASKPSKPIKESKGSSSKPVASTKPKTEEVISEGFDLKERFQKLAKIL